MSTLYMLVGVPGAGKSTWIKSQNFYLGKTVIVSTDAYIDKIAKMQDKTYNEVFKDNIRDAGSNLMTRVVGAVRGGDDIVWDQTNTTASSRAKKLRNIPSSYKKIAVFFATPEPEEHARRLERPGKTIPATVMKLMIATLEMPTVEEGFDEVIIA